MIWFTSDTHFGHKNIIEYSNRPFRRLDGQLDVDAMNNGLAERWNARVSPTDVVYHLGDFAMGKKEMLPTYRAKLNGKIILVRGNHDRSPTTMRIAGFDEVHEHLDITVDGIRLMLRHKPPPPQQRNAIGGPDWFLNGHVHTAWNRQGRCINVGVDVRGYQPVSIQELLADTEIRLGDPRDDDGD